MNSILNSISQLPLDRTAFISETNTISYFDIKQLHAKNLETIINLKGSCIVINGRQRAEFTLLLSILDGHTRRIVFLPEDIDESLVKRYYEETDANYEVYLDNDILKVETIKAYQTEQSNSTGTTQWIIPTSGTTNIPKLVIHTFESLTRTAQSNVEKGKHYRWGLVFDIYRFSGIQVFLQSIISGSTLIISENGNRMSEIIDLLSTNRCNALSATPSFWRKMLMSKGVDDLNLKRITLGGEIADQNILTALKTKFSNAKIAHIYASTEVGVGFSVKDTLEGFPKDYLENGVEKIKLKVDNNILWINPGTKTQKYMSNDSMYDDAGYINTGDLVKVSENRVFFLGRESGAINVGGNKVQPEEIESLLLSFEAVSAAYVYAKSNPMMGSLVYADIVLANQDIDKKSIKKEILTLCREMLEGFKVPAILKIVDHLETTQSGKLKRS